MSTSPFSAAIDVRPRDAVAVELFLVQRVRVRLGDDADARPARVREHRRLRGVGPQREAQQLVVADLRAQPRGVVAELTDLGRGLVDEREVAVGDAHRARGEQRIGAARRDQPRDRRVGEVEPVAGDEHVQPGGVAAAHLEPVERRQRDLDRVERVERGRPDGAPPTRSSTARAVPMRSRADRPQRVLARDRARRSAPRCSAPSRRAGVERGPRSRRASSAQRVGAVLERRPARPDRRASAPTPSPLAQLRGRRSASARAAARRARPRRVGDRRRAERAPRPRRASRRAPPDRAALRRRGVEPRPRCPHIDGRMSSEPASGACPNSAVSTDAPQPLGGRRRPPPAVGASTITRTSGSVPDARTSTRPASPSSASTARDRRRAARSPTPRSTAPRHPHVHEHLREPRHRARRAPTAAGPTRRTRSRDEQAGEHAVAGGRVVARR